MAERGANLGELIGDAVRGGADLAAKEMALFRAEMASNTSGILKGAAFVVAAAVFAVASLIWLTQAAAYGLELVVQSKWIAALIVGGVLLVIAIILALTGLHMITSSGLLPKRTAESLKRNTSLFSERAP